jgi:hypothetical protein
MITILIVPILIVVLVVASFFLSFLSFAFFFIFCDYLSHECVIRAAFTADLEPMSLASQSAVFLFNRSVGSPFFFGIIVVEHVARVSLVRLNSRTDNYCEVKYGLQPATNTLETILSLSVDCLSQSSISQDLPSRNGPKWDSIGAVSSDSVQNMVNLPIER